MGLWNMYADPLNTKYFELVSLNGDTDRPFRPLRDFIDASEVALMASRRLVRWGGV